MPINVRKRNDDEDFVAWFPNLDGKFSLKTAYSRWFEGSLGNRNSLYKHIWKSKAPHRLKAFMWLVANDALLTNFVQMRRKQTIDDSCVLCGVSAETMLHALCDCSKAK